MATQQLPRIEHQPRERLGSRYAARLRQQGWLPTVVYGHKKQPLHISINAKAFTDLLRRDAHLIELAMDAKNEPCLIKVVQWDHLGTTIIHVDLNRVDLSELVEVEVAVELTGEPKALQESGAILDHRLTTIEVRCRADQIPERIHRDINDLTTDRAVTVADLHLPEGVTAVTEPENVVAQITIVQEASEPEEGLEPVAASEEPEVIGKSGKEEAGAEGEGKAE